VILKIKITSRLSGLLSLFLKNTIYTKVWYFNEIVFSLLKNNVLLVDIKHKILSIYSSVFCIFLIIIDSYFININYNITEYPYFYKDIRNLDTKI